MENQYIAMWSGPRNISTAMMRSFGSRADTAVIDEPFYAHYLLETGTEHPGADEIIQSQSTDWRTVSQGITGAIPGNKSVFYQKHITTHMLEHIELDWLEPLTHCFLIRDPHSVVASYTQKRAEGAADDLGYVQQLRIFEFVTQQLQRQPLVVDSALLLQDPQGQLTALCAAIGIEYTSNMLSWEPGIRETDGVWHKYWYDAVATSTGFRPWSPKTPALDNNQKKIASACQPYYEALRSHALTTTDGQVF